MSSAMIGLFVDSFWETIIMVLVSWSVGAVVGLPLGVLLYLTAPGGVHSMPVLNRTVAMVVNALRSIPFIILLVAVIPFTRFIVGTSIGTAAAIVPLSIAAAPYIARLMETALREVDKGLIEAAESMGASTRQIIFKIFFPKVLPGIVVVLTLSFVVLCGY